MLSVIVPAYNSELYIEECIKSILQQNYRDIQLILVDDGSTDLTGDICDNYAQKDKRVQIVHTENQGAIAARIRGYNSAIGEFVTFVDADDWIDHNMYDNLMTLLCADEADFITSGMILENDNKDIVLDSLSEGSYLMNQNDNILETILWDFSTGKCGILPSLGNKIFKREFLKNALEFVDRKISLGEDRAIFYSAVVEAKSFIVTKQVYYHYRIHGESLCHNAIMTDFAKVQLFIDYLSEYYKKYALYEKVKSSLIRNFREVIDVAEKNAYGFINENYVFPFREIPQGSRVVIYGLGVVGRSFCRYLFLTKYAQVVAISDKALDGSKFNGISVIGIDEIMSYEFDYVLIANSREEIADSIKDDLLEAGLADENIKWVKPLMY